MSLHEEGKHSCSELSKITESNKIISPEYKKGEKIRFEMCLLHSKPADLICLEDKCLICANCGLFG